MVEGGMEWAGVVDGVMVEEGDDEGVTVVVREVEGVGEEPPPPEEMQDRSVTAPGGPGLIPEAWLPKPTPVVEVTWVGLV